MNVLVIFFFVLCHFFIEGCDSVLFLGVIGHIDLSSFFVQQMLSVGVVVPKGKINQN